MKKNIAIIAAVLALSTVAHAQNGGMGNGTAAGASASSYGGSNGFGKADLGYFDNWQTMSPAEREKLMAREPQSPSVASAKAEWPAWVHIEKPTSLAAQ